MKTIFERTIGSALIEESNSRLASAHEADLAALEEQLARREQPLGPILRKAGHFSGALPPWGFRQGGTRFGRFAGMREPATLEEKLFATALVNDLTRVTPGISLHFPWDQLEHVSSIRKLAHRLGIHFDAVNSNTFVGQPNQRHSYKFGS